MLIRELGPGGRWYVLAVHYPSALQAKRAWERCERKLVRDQTEDGIGLFRLAPNPDPAATVKTGAPDDAHCVVAVTLDEPMAKRATRLLRDGVEWLPDGSFIDAMILRRARVVHAHAGETGRLVTRRPDGRGASLSPTGDMIEHEPGQG